jgi:hypothetical protein
MFQHVTLTTEALEDSLDRPDAHLLPPSPALPSPPGPRAATSTCRRLEEEGIDADQTDARGGIVEWLAPQTNQSAASDGGR